MPDGFFGKNMVGQEQWARRGEADGQVQSLTTGLAAEAAARSAADTTATSAITTIQTADLVVPHIAGTVGNIATSGATWSSGQRFILEVGSTVITFTSGNSNVTFASAFPHGLSSVVVSNGDGPAGVILNTSNYSLSACGISAINSDGSLFGGGLRVNYTALGW